VNDSVEAVTKKLANAISFIDVFGEIPSSGTTAERQFALRRRFLHLATFVHPDKLPAEDAQAGARAFDALNKAHDAAREAIAANVYGKPFIGGPPWASQTWEMRSAKGVYRFAGTPTYRGDFAVIYRGMIEKGARAVLAKVAAAPTNNPWLEREATILEKGKATPWIPKLVDTFMAGGGGKKMRVIITEDVPNLQSVTDVMKRFPKGIDPRDAAWIQRRILGQVCTAERLGVVSTAIVPDHILLNEAKHEPLYIGWGHAVQPNTVVSHILPRWKDHYPPEILKKAPVSAQTDIFMAAKILVKLTNGARHSAFREYLAKSLDPNPQRRYGSGYEALDGLTRAVRAAWGSGYRPTIEPMPSKAAG